MDTPLINGVTYAWASIKATIMGVPIIGITKLEYSEEQEIEAVMGAGSRPVGVGYGDIKFEGSLTLHANEVEALQAASPDGRIQSLPPFIITVSFSAGGKVVTHRLISCIFKKNHRSSSSGDKKIDVDLPLFIGDIKWK